MFIETLATTWKLLVFTDTFLGFEVHRNQIQDSMKDYDVTTNYPKTLWKIMMFTKTISGFY